MAIVSRQQRQLSVTLKYVLFFITIIILQFGCANKKTSPKRPFKNFVFSYASQALVYAMKFKVSDTVFYHYYFDGYYNQPKHHKTYMAIADKKDLQTLDSFLTTINFSAYDTTYVQESLQDGSGRKFNFSNDSSTHWVYIYGHEGPAQLNNFAKWLINLESRQHQVSVDSMIDFGSLDYILPPSAPPPPKTE